MLTASCSGYLYTDTDGSPVCSQLWFGQEVVTVENFQQIVVVQALCVCALLWLLWRGRRR